MTQRFAHRPFVTASAKTVDLPHDWFSHGCIGISTNDPVRADKWRALAAARGVKVRETDDKLRTEQAARARRYRAKFASGARQRQGGRQRDQIGYDREVARLAAQAWEAAEAAVAGWAPAPPAAEPDATPTSAPPAVEPGESADTPARYDHAGRELEPWETDP